MSARNIDHGTGFDARLRGIKAGTEVSLSQVCPTCPTRKIKTKYDIIGMTIFLDYEFAFIDGMNSEGLGAGGLMDVGIVSYPDWDPSGAPTAIAFKDSIGYILANYKTVPEVQAAVTADKIQWTKAYIGSQLIPVFPVHVSLTDALGNAAVMQFKEKIAFNWTGGYPVTSPDAMYTIPSNTLHALANTPNLEFQNAAYNWFQQRGPDLTPEYVDPYLQIQYSGTALYETAKSKFVNVPGDYSSISRRIRLAMYRQFQAQGNMPTHVTWEGGKAPINAEGWSPNYGNDAWLNAFYMAANGIMHAAQIVGYSDQGLKLDPDTSMNNPFDMKTTLGLDVTIFSIIRDHTTRQYFWWSGRAQRWQQFDLKAMTQSFQACPTPLPVVTSALYDRTATLTNTATKGSSGVAVSAVGTVASSVCANPSCPSTLSKFKNIRIRCRCNGQRGVTDASGCAAPPTRAQIIAAAQAILNGNPVSAPPQSSFGALAIHVTDCKSLTAQECCNWFAKAVASGQTPLPVKSPVSCIMSSGATLAPSKDGKDRD